MLLKGPATSDATVNARTDANTNSNFIEPKVSLTRKIDNGKIDIVVVTEQSSALSLFQMKLLSSRHSCGTTFNIAPCPKHGMLGA